MMVRLIYRPASEQARPAEEFWHEYQRRTGRALATIDPDTPEGSALCHPNLLRRASLRMLLRQRARRPSSQGGYHAAPSAGYLAACW